MSAYVVWIDHEHAKIFHLSAEDKSKISLKKHEVRHHTSHSKDHQKDASKFFHEVAGQLSGAKELLLVGPGLGKTHFEAHLKEHHHAALAKAVVGVKTCSEISDNEVLALAREFFKTYDQFH